MLGPESFFSTVDGLKILQKGDKVAFFTNGANVRARKDYHCKVNDSCYHEYYNVLNTYQIIRTIFISFIHCQYKSKKD